MSTRGSARWVTNREADISTAMAAAAMVFHEMLASIKENGKEAPETKALEKQFSYFNSIKVGVQCGDMASIRKVRRTVRKFVEKRNPRRIINGVIYGRLDPPQLRP